ncbi:MAG: ribonuclease T2 [Cocleimonas sp.]|nr:ribonuclease T2 [Cocleimonas sp.]
MKILFLFITLSLLPLSYLHASEKLEGCFEAKKSCDAFRSLRKKTNPNNIQLKIGKEYRLIAKNKANAATHYQVIVKGATPEARWIEIECGKIVKNCSISSSKVAINQSKNNKYLLALSWQPSFCETHRKKPECKSLTATRFDASHLVLHGLWPQPRNNAYCGVSVKDKSIDRKRRWDLLKPLTLEPAVLKELKKVMPGYASNLQRHEWIKHGTCYGKNENAYYADALALTAEINASAITSLFKDNIGKKITSQQIRERFDQVFGKGSGKKVSLRCDRKGQIAELWINLKGNMQNERSLKNLLSNADNTKSNCNSGIVDPA